jgi:cytochrome oxidase assembly protein ShyY1
MKGVDRWITNGLTGLTVTPAILEALLATWQEERLTHKTGNNR